MTHLDLAALAAPAGHGAALMTVRLDVGSATLLVILLLGSLTAGLFFASPLGRRMARAAEAQFAGDDAPRGPAQWRRGREIADRLLDRLGERIAARGRRFRPRPPATPLPPMLGGDIFFEDAPSPAAGLAVASSTAELVQPVPATGQPGHLWSTEPPLLDRDWPRG